MLDLLQQIQQYASSEDCDPEKALEAINVYLAGMQKGLEKRLAKETEDLGESA